MSRVQIDMPASFNYSCELTVRASDINYGGHVGHDRILTLLQEARVLFYRSLGFADEMSLGDGVGHVIADAAVVYKSEAFMGDVLLIQLAVGDFGRVGFDMFGRITNKSTSKEIALAKTGLVCFDYEKRKVAAVPELLMQKIKSSRAE